MTSATILPVILSGGAGSRLWPMSTPERPKQMLALAAEVTMLQATVSRATGAAFAPPIIVANERHAELVEQQLAAVDVQPQSLILEPAGRNTAPAIALAALASPVADKLLLVMPSDHVIADVTAFLEAVAQAVPIAAQGWLVTFGIAPDAPETGYGWIEIGDLIGDGIHKVARFVEKPPLAQAEAMLAGGEHAWNGGIFLFRADTYLSALGAYEPEVFAACEQAMALATREGARIFPDVTSFVASPAQSIDFAVMERADRVAVVPVAMGWNDLGSWDALHEISARDAAGNAHHGEVIALDTRDCLVRSDGVRLCLVGVSDLIVVASGDDILILPRGRSQEVKKLVEAMAW